MKICSLVDYEKLANLSYVWALPLLDHYYDERRARGDKNLESGRWHCHGTFALGQGPQMLEAEPKSWVAFMLGTKCVHVIYQSSIAIK